MFETFDKFIHDRVNFDCGSVELNEFLKTQANQRQKKNNAVTHVAVEKRAHITPKIIYGYYTISSYAVEFGILPEKIDCFFSIIMSSNSSIGWKSVA